jgi:hypothetical protein
MNDAVAVELGERASDASSDAQSVADVQPGRWR